ncbi:hypothetical protein L3Q67_31830 [Saccharothrix sp. AJ9571]|nr:hypothetical protein L3Q67_31830 [Saccharothrix sp. AJ9571]
MTERSGPLTFGQLSVWRDVRSLPEERAANANVATSLSLPPGTTVESVQRALRKVVARHGSLRTTYDLSEWDGPMQTEHHEPLTWPVTVVDHDDDPVGGLDIEKDHGWLVKIVADNGHATSLSLVNHHIVADAGAQVVLREDITKALDGSLGEATGPLDLAARQQAPASRARNAAAVDNWRRSLSEPAEVAWADGPGTVQASLTTADLIPATERIAARAEVSASCVLLTAYLTAVREFAPVDEVPVRLMSANRFSAVTQDLVTSLNQWVPMWWPGVDGDFRAALADLQTRSLKAYRLGTYDPAAVAAFRPSRPKWEEPVWGFNFITGRPATVGAGEPTVRVEPVGNLFGHRFYLRAFASGTLRLRAGGLDTEVVGKLLGRIHELVLTNAKVAG